MHRGTWVYAILLLFAAIPESWSQAKEETTIRELVQRASQAGDRQIWGRLIIQADAEAAKLERRERNDCCDTRCINLRGFGDLHYRWNELQQSENYEHDLLRTVIHELRGTPSGADALATLLSL